MYASNDKDYWFVHFSIECKSCDFFPSTFRQHLFSIYFFFLIANNHRTWQKNINSTYVNIWFVKYRLLICSAISTRRVFLLLFAMNYFLRIKHETYVVYDDHIISIRLFTGFQSGMRNVEQLVPCAMKLEIGLWHT